MLPQEAKVIGDDEEIIFCKGLHPIRCQKVRYHQDRRFRKRLLAPPEAAVPLIAGDIGSHSSVARSKARGGDPDMLGAIRVATPGDIDHWASLTAADFGARLDDIVVPESSDGQRLASEAIDAVQAQFLRSMAID